MRIPRTARCSRVAPARAGLATLLCVCACACAGAAARVLARPDASAQGSPARPGAADPQPGSLGPGAPPTAAAPGAAADTRGVRAGVYTIEQAARGQAAYRQACAQCHAADLLGAQFAPALVGQPFADRWKNRSLDDVLQTIRRTMPQDAPDSLGTRAYVDILGYMLKSQGLPAGASELPNDPDALSHILVDLP